MRIEPNPTLRQWLQDQPLHANLLGGFEVDPAALSRFSHEVWSRHPDYNSEQREAWAQFSAACEWEKLHRPKETVKAPENVMIQGGIPVILPPQKPQEIVLTRAMKLWAWAVILLLLLLVMRAHAGEPYIKPSIRILAPYRLLLQVPHDPILIQLRNAGSTLDTRQAGLVIFDCTTNMTCSWAGNTFTITATSTAGTAWSALTAPTANLALAHAALTTTFTWNATTGTADLFTYRDTASNTGTGHIVLIHTQSGSAAKPIAITAAGTANGVEMSTTGSLGIIGTGAIVATTGDTATAFFSAGQIEAARGGTNVDSSASTGVARTSSGTWSFDATIAHLASSTSANLAGVLSDESGTGVAIFGTSPTITTPTISGAISFPDGIRQTFNPDATIPGFNVGSQAGDPSTPANGDVTYNSTSNKFRCYENGAWANCVGGAGGTPGGADTQVQFNDAGAFGGDADLTWNKTTNILANAGRWRNGGTAGDVASPVKGDAWYNTTQEAHRFADEMGTKGLVGLWFAQTTVAAGDTVTNTTTETDFATTATAFPANTLEVGKVIRVTAGGTHLNNSGANVNFTYRIKFGANKVCDARGVSAVGTSTERQDWFVTCTLTVFTTGASGTTESLYHAVGGTTSGVFTQRGNTTNNPFTLNTTVSQAVTISVQFGTAATTIDAVLRSLVVEVLN